MNKIITSFMVGSVLLLLTACGSGAVDDDFENPVGSANFNSGDLDLSRYVALGDSLTAGYKDGALYRDGQLNSFPAILAQLFARAGGGSFSQPIVSDNLGGLLLATNPIPDFDTRLVLTAGSNPGDLTPIRQPGTPTTDIINLASGSFNNVGVPGAKSFHLLAANYGDVAGVLTSPATANPFYVRFAESTTTTVLADAMTPIPSFFSLWIGNNDILGYALSGGDGSDPITDTTTFTNAYSFMIATLLGAGAKGVVINIPSVTDIPYFTTVPYNAIPLDSVGAATANTAFAVYNSGLSAAVSGSLITQLEADERTINFVAGQNAVVIVDEGLTDLTGLMLPSYRQATAADLILLPLSSTLGTLRDSGDPTSAIGIGSPLLDGEVLTMSEVDEIETARTAFNTVISNLASASDNLAFYDAAALLADLNDGNGISYGTGSVDSTFGTGGAFSLDGVHPTARGYAIVANGIIESLSATFNAELPKTDPGTYSEIFFEYPAGYDFD